MQKSDRNQKYSTHSPVAIRTCPECGDKKIRKSSTHTSDGLLKILFCKAYRCSTCRYRFWEFNPLRLVFFMGILILLIPVFVSLWISFHQQPVVVATSVQAPSNDQIKSLAEKGDAEAELQMGLRYLSIAWGIKDDKIAAQWFEKAAQHNQIKAQYRYGLALLEGQGVVQDYKTAFYWLEKAAQQGHAQAQAALGEMYHAGIAVKGDMERAYLWFNLAAAQGVKSAASARDIVVKLLAPGQVAAMQEEAGRISRGYRSTYVADEPTTVILEPYPEEIGSSPPDDSKPVAEEPTVKSVILMLKDWWKKQP